MSVLRFQIRQPSGQVDQLLIESERVRIGSGAHCEIRLPLVQAAIEHALIQVGPAGVFVQAMSFQPPPTVNNVPFTQGPLTPEAVLGIGQFQITVALAADGAQGAVATKKKGGSNVSLIALVVLIIGGGYYFFMGDTAATGVVAPKDAPELWGPPVDACPQRIPEQAIALARERNVVADAKRERRPFHIKDGIDAVPLYELASVCYRTAGDQNSAVETAGAAVALRKELNDDYRTHRVRLDHFLHLEDPPPPDPPLNLIAARKEVRLLLQFTEGKQGDYVSWLSNLDRKLKLKLGRPS